MELFCNGYDKSQRPNGKNATNVRVEVYLHTISLDEKSEELEIVTWMRLVFSQLLQVNEGSNELILNTFRAGMILP